MKASVLGFCVLGLLVVVASFSGQVDAAEENCNFSAVYIFGDSNSYTGPLPGGQQPIEPPRACDGRLLVDLISENLMLRKVQPYITVNGLIRTYKGGASFAKAGAPIVKDRGFSPFHLDYQISQFIQFKNTNRLTKDDLSKALYIIDIGQNDISVAYERWWDVTVRGYFRDMLNNFNNGLRRLFDEGARTFLVHNVGPLGCLPKFVKKAITKPEDIDPLGCVQSMNEAITEFNKQLNTTICNFRDDLAGAAITYVDVYEAKYETTRRATGSLVFKNPVKSACCVNGTNCCNDPWTYISWDGIHYTQAANDLIAEMIIKGSFSSPPEPIADACNACSDKQQCGT